GKAWLLASWATTMALVSLGWIFFRANSLAQAGAMFSALFRISSYPQHFLSSGLYLLLMGGAAVYALTLATVDALERYSQGFESGSALGIFLRDRWVWLAPMWVAASLLLLTAIPTQGRAANVFMYRFF